jgi:site-specific DNA-methyltransferase (adenine-specific)/site-specific DNA-methyltransferase (cytosine-N4-specific)
MSNEAELSSADASLEDRSKYEASLSLDLADETSQSDERICNYAAPACTIILADALSGLVTLPDRAFRCCVTSPPYWGLRDYGVSAELQIGAEARLEDYIAKLTGIFSEVYRVLADNGTLWLNLGDAYTSGGRSWRAGDKKNPARAMQYRPPTPAGLKPKDLIGVPWRVAFALQAAGWYLRSEVIWEKPNCQPESVKDRPTRCHEHVFMLTKSEAYLYNYEAVKEQSNGSGRRNRRTVWTIPTEAYPGAHFATFPASLVVPCVLASSNPGDSVLDPFFGSGTVGEVCLKLGRNCLGIEVKPEYKCLARVRLGLQSENDESGTSQ